MLLFHGLLGAVLAHIELWLGEELFRQHSGERIRENNRFVSRMELDCTCDRVISHDVMCTLCFAHDKALEKPLPGALYLLYIDM